LGIILKEIKGKEGKEKDQQWKVINKKYGRKYAK
jgi:hypothetical protein